MMLNLIKYENSIYSNNIKQFSLNPINHSYSKPSFHYYSSLSDKKFSLFPPHHISKLTSLKTQKSKLRRSVILCSEKRRTSVKEKKEYSESEKMVVEGIVILKKKTITRIIDGVTSFFHVRDDLIKGKVSLQLVSAVHVDPVNSKGKLGKRSYLEEVVKDTSLADGESAFKVKFDWDNDVSLPGAVIIRNEDDTEFYLKTITLKDIPGHGKIHFLCNSWVYPAKYYQNDRIFFTNKTYLPDQTPEPLIKYRNEELEILRGKGKENQMLQEWDRVYDYALYNDLGEPDKGRKHVRPILGGSAEFPYPRRGRTSRPPTKKDPKTESRLLAVKGTEVYCPRDEKFNHLKFNDFLGDTVKSISQGINGLLDAIFDKTPKEFDSFEEVMRMYEGVSLPDTQAFRDFRKNVPTKFLKSFFRSDGAPILKYPLPDIVKKDKSAWKTDEEFAKQIVAGIHPVIIRRLEEFPPVSKLDPKIYGNQNSSITKESIEKNLNSLSVEEAIKSNKLYILDHHDTVMPFLRKINSETPSRVYATRTLLFLRDDGTLKPLVIELSLPHPKGDKFGAISKVYTPASEEGVEASLWLLAKTFVSVTDSAYHQLISHWLHTHAVMEPLIIATNRQLSKLHPVYKLLYPHFRDTMPVNIVARQIALNADGLFEAAVYPRQLVGKWTSALYKDWVFTDQALPRDLIKRGMAVKDSKSSHGYKLHIEDYPYAVDGLEIWSAIETWVKDYCLYYYKSDDMVAKDPELQTWWKEIREVGHGDKKDEKWWPEMKTLNELIETCTTIIWVASALHAVVNFGQYPYSGYMPNRPTISRRFMPEPSEYEELKKDPEGFFLKTVTSQRRTLACLSVIELISRHSEDEVYLGEREPGWTSDTPPIEAFEKFSKKLVEIEKRILERNNDPKLKNRVGPAKLPFILLCPSSGVGITGRGIPNSVSI